MTELRTRIVLCNDVTANWLTNSSKILLKGEVGIEFLDDGKAKIKIGDGVKTWEQLDYFGGEALVGDDNAIVINGQTITGRKMKKILIHGITSLPQLRMS